MRRMMVNKGRSARQFRSKCGSCKQANMMMPMRGGWRM